MTTYIQSAMRTNSDVVGTHGRASIDFMHATAGMVTEIEEMRLAVLASDITNFNEELGDLQWFMALACHAFGYEDMPAGNYYMADDPATMHINIMSGTATLLLDAAKGWFAYGKEPDPKAVFAGLASLVTHSGAASRMMKGDTLHDARLRNLRKLETRYPGKFTTAAAIDRDFDAEREALS